MNNHNILFALNSTEKMVILLKEPIEWLGPIYQEDIILINNKNIVPLANGPIYHNIQQLEEFLKKALANDLQLHESITQDVGYLCNEYYNDKTHFVIKNFNGNDTWIGYEYNMWAFSTCNARTTTWIYNNKNKNIILEIAPHYPYFFCEPAEEPDYIPYNEWIKTYKPYLIREIPTEIAQEWLTQAKFIIKTIEKNEEKWQKSKCFK